jgi:hypothetical protein
MEITITPAGHIGNPHREIYLPGTEDEIMADVEQMRLDGVFLVEFGDGSRDCMPATARRFRDLGFTTAPGDRRSIVVSK